MAGFQVKRPESRTLGAAHSWGQAEAGHLPLNSQGSGLEIRRVWDLESQGKQAVWMQREGVHTGCW